MKDTIAAISTSLGVGAISIIRVSGDNSIEIVNSITKNKNLTDALTHTIHYDFIVDKDKIIDEVLISVMMSPKTFTKEDVVEINCHGGIATTNKVLELLLTNGCRLAEPGEFTKRAFLNGRINLNQAEAVMDLINSKTEKARTLAINGITGNVSNMIKDLRDKLVGLIASIEVNIDYPEYDNEDVTEKDVENELGNIKKKLNEIINNSENGKIIKEGIKTSIIGKPNVGKSSILNALLDEEKAIVTDIEGTTRDVVEGTLSIDGIIFNILDTAGIRDTSDTVEKIGVEKSLKLIDESDLILFVLNNNEELTTEEEEILDKLKDKNYIIIVNKIDLDKKININDNNIVYLSALNKVGIEDLKKKIKEIFNLEKLETSDLNYLTGTKNIAILKEALKSIDDVEEAIKNNMPIDMLEIDIKNIWTSLGTIIGETYSEELIDEMFSRFCLGK
ncbi:MAG: tRNA uridine-5-carboxymethylaminomethyl(34) synthesis GTPase MnmE [Bacillales bacterium]|nr:tRNA uridine-5-carboxymethylaminomethyl(34) synthesis GTPase MnmE [Bacillales bacterium]